MIKFKPAPAYYRLLNGIMCVFKPEGVCSFQVAERLQCILSRELNSMLCYNFEDSNDTYSSIDKTYLGVKPILDNHGTTALSNNYVSTPLTSISPSSSLNPGEQSLPQPLSNQYTAVSSFPSAEQTDILNEMNDVKQTDKAFKLVFGDRYIPEDIKVCYIDSLAKHSTGVILFGFGKQGKESIQMIGDSKLLRVYHVKGRLGYCTQNFSPKGKFIERSTFQHITQSKIDKLCATTQAAFSREMYRYSGVSPDSQEAYELASSGIIRPAERRTAPIVYGIKCIHFQPPDFTLEVHAINERCYFLQKLIHDMAVQMKSRAVCTGVRRLRYGYFGVDQALVRHQWNLENVIKNIDENEGLLVSELLD